METNFDKNANSMFQRGLMAVAPCNSCVYRSALMFKHFTLQVKEEWSHFAAAFGSACDKGFLNPNDLNFSISKQLECYSGDLLGVFEKLKTKNSHDKTFGFVKTEDNKIIGIRKGWFLGYLLVLAHPTFFSQKLCD
jgi:hypothetical protein